jgi:hypothetical protein
MAIRKRNIRTLRISIRLRISGEGSGRVGAAIQLIPLPVQKTTR